MKHMTTFFVSPHLFSNIQKSAQQSEDGKFVLNISIIYNEMHKDFIGQSGLFFFFNCKSDSYYLIVSAV